MADVWASLGVALGLGLVWLTHWDFLDPVIALAVAGNIAWAGASLIMRSFNGLMDHALPAPEQAAVRAAVHGVLPAGLHFHALRTRQAGSRRFVDFHLLVPGRWTVQKAHDLTEQVEDAIGRALANVEVTVHIEPLEAEASWKDSALLQVEEDDKPKARTGEPPT